MLNIRSAVRFLTLVYAFNVFVAFGSEHPTPQPVATLDITGFVPNLPDLTFTTVAFSSETTIEVIACATPKRDATCPSSTFRWNNGLLKRVIEPVELNAEYRTSSADGKRILFDLNDRKVPRYQHLFDDVRAIATFGMIYPEEFNREVVQVVDTSTRKSCFDWRHTFSMTSGQRRLAAISPSGEFVAIKVENSLSVYRLPSVCEGAKVHRLTE